jgi:LysR family transcriptional regulator, pca operon transcriptional activator
MIDGHIKFRHLQCFLAVSQHRNLHRAADALSITQPAVSKTLKELEDILGVRLFERGRAGAVLTREAEIFFKHAQTSVSALEQAQLAMAHVRGMASPILRIGASPTLTGSFLPAVLLVLGERLPHLQVSLLTGTTAQLMMQLREGEFDLALCRHVEPEQMVGLSFEYLFIDPLVAVVRPGHPLLQTASVRPADVGAYTAVLPIKGSVNRQVVDKLIHDLGLGTPTNFIENLSVTFGRIYTASSDAVWYVPWSAVTYDVAAGSLVRLPLPDAQADGPAGVSARTIGLMTRANSTPSPAVQTLVAIIREVAGARRASAP